MGGAFTGGRDYMISHDRSIVNNESFISQADILSTELNRLVHISNEPLKKLLTAFFTAQYLHIN